MRILLAHNLYQQTGGEDVVLSAESDLLVGHGHEVRQLLRHNDEIHGMSRVALAASAVWSRESALRVDAAAEDFVPDVIHVHNSFPLLSPSIYWAAAAHRIPVIQTLHNFRLLCPQAMLLREGRVCEDCVGHVPWRAALHRCYRGSAAQSAIVAGSITLHRMLGTYRRKITRYIALNDFCRDKFIAGGIPGDRICVKPHFVDFKPPEPQPQPRSGFLFVGRLAPEKGIDLLARVMTAHPSFALRVAGSGPAEHQLTSSNIESLGHLDRAAVCDEMARCLALVVPSIWYETFGLVVIEAYACATPVIASRIGDLPDLVEHGVTGLLFEPGDSDDLARCLQFAVDNPERMREMGARAFQRYQARYTPEANYRQLMDIYNSAIAEVATGAPVTAR